MKVTTILPESFHFYHALNLANRKLMWAQNLIGIILLFFFAWIFMGVAAALNPRFFWLSLYLFAGNVRIVPFLLTAVLIVILHELLHAWGFYWFTKERPMIKFHILYAYTTAPQHYFPRNPFILITLLPLLAITAVGILLLPFITLSTLPYLILALTLNAAGSIGDMVIALWLFSQPADTLVRSEGACISLYR